VLRTSYVPVSLLSAPKAEKINASLSSSVAVQVSHKLKNSLRERSCWLVGTGTATLNTYGRSKILRIHPRWGKNSPSDSRSV